MRISVTVLIMVNDRLDHVNIIISNDLDILEYEEDEVVSYNLI